MADMLTVACRSFDPQSTDETLEVVVAETELKYARPRVRRRWLFNLAKNQ